MPRILLLEARSLGDAVIKNGLIKQMCSVKHNYQVDVFTKEELKGVFTDNPHINHIYLGKFPINNYKSYDIITLFRMIFLLRKEKYDYCLDLMGDFREQLIVKMIAGDKAYSVKRSKAHPFCRLIHSLPVKLNTIFIPDTIVNFYKQCSYVLGCLEIQPSFFKMTNRKGLHRIGIHPMASQDCKMWTYEKWRILIGKLCKDGYEVVLFCSPAERVHVYEHFAVFDEIRTFSICAVDLQQFFHRLEKLDLLIGLDSFSIHAAYSLGLPNILLCGGNDYRLWETPSSKVVVHPTECKYWPCYNRPKCEGKDKYKCIRSINPDEVLTKVAEWDDLYKT